MTRKQNEKKPNDSSIEHMVGRSALAVVADGEGH